MAPGQIALGNSVKEDILGVPTGKLQGHPLVAVLALASPFPPYAHFEGQGLDTIGNHE